MTKTHMPTSKAKTAYGLLTEIAALAIAEPKRIAMSTWRQTASSGVMVLTHTVFPNAPRAVTMPACGTVGCIGGWFQTLSGRSPYEVIGDTLQEELCYPHALCCAAKQQTAAHARAVVAHIRRFQKKYRAFLLATKVR